MGNENLKPKLDGDFKLPEKSEKSNSEKYKQFQSELKTKYGEEFVFTAMGFSQEKYQEITPFGVNYEKNIRDFVKKFPNFSEKLKNKYQESTGKSHILIEKALAQNEYLKTIYKNKPINQTDLTLPLEKRVYYDSDGYPNLKIDPHFYDFVENKKSLGISSSTEILDLFSAEFPEKSSGYKVILKNSDKWEQKATKSEKLSELINEQGIQTVPKTIEINGQKLETIVFPQQPDNEKKVRVYRGVVSADQTILRQLPYAARGKIELIDSEAENQRGLLNSVVSEVPGIEETVNEMAKNPSMDNLQKYANQMRIYFLKNNMSKELEYLDQKILTFSKEILNGTSLEALLSVEQTSGGMYTAEYLIAPYVSATPKIGEALSYGRGGVIVYDIPETELKNLSSNNECMVNGVIDSKYIKMFIYPPKTLSAPEVEEGINKNIEGNIYSLPELDSLGSKIKETREINENKNLSENLKIAATILVNQEVSKFDLISLDSKKYLAELENYNFTDYENSRNSLLIITEKINDEYFNYLSNYSSVYEIAQPLLQEITQQSGDLKSKTLESLFKRIQVKKELLQKRLAESLPEMQIDYSVIVNQAQKNGTTLNQEIYSKIKSYCDDKNISIPQILEDNYNFG
jgi:hypothetical protein